MVLYSNKSIKQQWPSTHAMQIKYSVWGSFHLNEVHPLQKKLIWEIRSGLCVDMLQTISASLSQYCQIIYIYIVYILSYFRHTSVCYFWLIKSRPVGLSAGSFRLIQFHSKSSASDCHSLDDLALSVSWLTARCRDYIGSITAIMVSEWHFCALIGYTRPPFLGCI